MTNTVLLSLSVSCNLFLSHSPFICFSPLVSLSTKAHLFNKQGNLQSSPLLVVPFYVCASGVSYAVERHVVRFILLLFTIVMK